MLRHLDPQRCRSFPESQHTDSELDHRDMDEVRIWLQQLLVDFVLEIVVAIPLRR